MKLEKLDVFVSSKLPRAINVQTRFTDSYTNKGMNNKKLF